MANWWKAGKRPAGRSSPDAACVTCLTDSTTMGLSLLYVDERVRHEGYDIELLAAQRFGEMPTLPAGVHAPVAPAIAPPQSKRTREEENFPGSVLGL